MSKKTAKAGNLHAQKETFQARTSSDTKKVIWAFDMIDNSADFAFNVQKISENGDLDTIVSKMIEYNQLTWSEIKKQTHDRSNKSKHHFLDFDGMSKEAADRIHKLELEEYEDSIFSFALQNKLRVIGVRTNEVFHVVWYDPEHKFYPSKKR
jgi:hypothetical protein